MQRRLILAIVSLCFISIGASEACAKDWMAIIGKLENGPRTSETDSQIAICSNNLALEYEREKDWNNAEKWMKKAYHLDRNEPLYQKHLGDIYVAQAFELFEKRSSQNVSGAMHRRAKLLAERALGFNRSLVEAHILIGKIEYDNQKMSAAKSAFQAASRLAPNSPVIRDFLAKIDRESQVEKQFTKTANSFFEIRYQNSVDAETAAGLRYAMETARDVVGRDYNFRPRHKTILLVYSSDVFADLQLGPHWSAGVYDGKIRLPLDGESNLAFAVATLFHEYTHAVLHDLAKSQCPRWLNEGLAEVQGQKVKPREISELHTTAKLDGLIPLRQLDSAFSSSSTRAVRLGYEQSHSVASYMIDTHGYRNVRKLLEQLGAEVPLEVALRKTLNTTLVELEADWKATLLATISGE